jgi:hypothetical protein
MTLLLFYVAIFAWLLIGWLCWQATYYSIIRAWYYKFDEDLREWNGGNNSLQVIRGCIPIFVSAGILILIVMLPDIIKRKTPFDYGLTLYFKIPKDGSRKQDSRHIQAGDN